MSYRGVAIAGCPVLSTKGAFGLATIFEDDYATTVLSEAAKLTTRDDGFYAGAYADGKPNKSLNINTNSIVLEALLYLKRGRKPFLDPSKDYEQDSQTLVTDDVQAQSSAPPPDSESAINE